MAFEAVQEDLDARVQRLRVAGRKHLVCRVVWPTETSEVPAKHAEGREKTDLRREKRMKKLLITSGDPKFRSRSGRRRRKEGAGGGALVGGFRSGGAPSSLSPQLSSWGGSVLLRLTPLMGAVGIIGLGGVMRNITHIWPPITRWPGAAEANLTLASRNSGSEQRWRFGID